MASCTQVLLLLLILNAAIASIQESEFNNDVEFVENTGSRFRLKSNGKLANVIDLDQETAVRRVLCKGLKILVALNTDEPEIDWDEGHLVLGSSKWKCRNNALKPESSTIYAKITSVKRPKDGVVELLTSAAGPLEMFEEADIQVHYEQSKEPVSPHRQKRRVSNLLQKALKDIHWNASVSSSLPFNEADKPISVYKTRGDPNIIINQDGHPEPVSPEFIFRCSSCHGRSHMSYHFELKVNKVNNKPNIQKYLMQVEIDSEVHQNYTLDSSKEQTLTRSATLWTTDSQPLFKAPVAVFKTLSPIILSVSYTSQANIELMSTTRSAVRHADHFDLQGKTIISQRYEKGQPAVNDVTMYNWTVSNSDQVLKSNTSMNTSFAFFQNVTISPAISWAQKDVDMNLGQPVHVSLRPTVNVQSNAKDDAVSRCDSTSLTVDSNVSVAETDFTVDAFNIHIWNVKIADPLQKKLLVLKKQLSKRCSANCHRVTVFEDKSRMHSLCGAPEGKIVRGDPLFSKLHQLWGDLVLFASEEFNTSTWCGRRDRKCIDCSHSTAGETADSACADRMMTTDLASAITMLARYSRIEWPDRKIIVKEAWDEPTSQYPHGQHGDSSIFYEGRAAEVAISLPLSSSPGVIEDTESSVLKRLAELAFCSGFKSVHKGAKQASLEMCVRASVPNNKKKRNLLSRKRRSGEIHHPDVNGLLQSVEDHATQSAKSPGKQNKSINIEYGKNYPAMLTLEEACGGPAGRVSLDHPERFQRVVYYPQDDIQFDNEGPPGAWCGAETRQCGTCNVIPDQTDPWNWCTTRTMTMRLAARLKQLSVFTNNTVRVRNALTLNLTSNTSGLYSEGRAARLSLKAGSTLSMKQFSFFAAKAGFDSVKYTSNDYIEVCVKQQDGLQANINLFPLINLVGVAIPVGEEKEYGYPETLAHEPQKPLLFDAESTHNDISYHFKLHHIQSPGVRYFRLDPVLINLLELAYDDFLDGLHIIQGSAYRPRSVNINNIEGRHPKEVHRYQMGQAVEIQPNAAVTDDSLFDLGMSLMRVARTIRTKRLGIGIGTKMDRLYFDIRPLDFEHALKYLDVWDSGNTDLYKRLKLIQDLVYKGGSILPAITDEQTCKVSALGAEYFYFGFDLDHLGFCPDSDDSHCAESHEHRYNISLTFQASLSRAAGPDRLPRPDILPLVQQCVVDLCGGCPEAGDIWRQKVIACTKMITKYLSRASMPFQPLKNKVSIFNTDNDQSSVHSLACHDGRICVENTQIYSLLLPLITATYRTGPSEEMLFGGADNPTPLLEIVEQELAWRAEGTVHVYIDSEKDVSALRNILKIVMILNKNVTEVEFHIDPDVDKNDVMNDVLRKFEEWSGSTCPKWSRLVIPPYKFLTISHSRKKRSLERSNDRNKLKQTINNWEVDWMLNS